MKKITVFISVAALAVASTFWLVATPAQAVDTENLNNFRISSYDIDYTLSKNDKDQSVLQTKETIVADFTVKYQNHGIERYIPESYDGHTTNLNIDSIVDEKGQELDYETYNENDGIVLQIGDKDSYVYGQKTYVISYSQQEVTKYFSDTERDEFYWDTNGTDWRVPIDKLTVTLAVDSALRDSLTGDNACYQGVYQSTDTCDLSVDGGQFEVVAEGLAAGENVSLAVGFNKGTFSAHEQTWYEQAFGVIYAIQQKTFAVGTIIGTVLMIIASVLSPRIASRKKEQKPFITEYIPPRDTSVTMSSTMLPNARNAFTAQLIDLAVRHYIKIYETEPKAAFRQAKYDVEIVQDISTLKDEEQEILRDIFSGGTTVGARVSLSDIKRNISVIRGLSDNAGKAKKLAREKYGLYYKDDTKRRPYKIMAIVLLVAGVLTFNPVLLVFAIVFVVIAYSMWMFTDNGLALYKYLLGLKQYIGAAETERIEMLQSPAGAEKVGVVNSGDSSQMIKLYERTLPYAILFGQEKEWGSRLEYYYTTSGTQSDWLTGVGTGNALSSFSGSLRSFSAASTASSSSATGGSSGGGSSGGGGGGGGGGGW